MMQSWLLWRFRSLTANIRRGTKYENNFIRLNLKNSSRKNCETFVNNNYIVCIGINNIRSLPGVRASFDKNNENKNFNKKSEEEMVSLYYIYIYIYSIQCRTVVIKYLNTTKIFQVDPPSKHYYYQYIKYFYIVI